MRAAAAGFVGALALAACGDGTPSYTVSGNAFDFAGSPEARIAGATVTLVEDPTRTTVTAADGSFAFDGFARGDEATFDLTFPNYHPVRTGTLVIEGDVERLSFQVVHEAIYTALADSLAIQPDPTKCQIVTTVTRIGKSIYDMGAHGEAGATVAMAPATGAAEGPIYFNSSVQPERGLTETSDDGGVLFLNVTPGEYGLTATKAGATFRTFKMKCAAGLLVNASPPWGLQRLQ